MVPLGISRRLLSLRRALVRPRGGCRRRLINLETIAGCAGREGEFGRHSLDLSSGVLRVVLRYSSARPDEKERLVNKADAG